MKSFLPKVCECGTNLTIQYGKTPDIIKLVCPNPDCCCSVLKKLQKGIIALDIRGLGPSTIEKLSLSGIESSLDLFDKTKFNEQSLCESGNFVKGRSLKKMIDAVYNIKEIHIQKAILSLQLKDIGKTFSEKIGKIVSGMEPDLTGLQLDIREQLSSKSSPLYVSILNAIKKFEENGIKIIKYETKKVEPVAVKKITKSIATTVDSELFKKLEWNIVEIDDPSCQMLVVNEKDEMNEKVKFAKQNNIKILTINQVNLLFG